MSICFLSDHYWVKPNFERAALGKTDNGLVTMSLPRATDFAIILFDKIECFK